MLRNPKGNRYLFPASLHLRGMVLLFPSHGCCLRLRVGKSACLACLPYLGLWGVPPGLPRRTFRSISVSSINLGLALASQGKYDEGFKAFLEVLPRGSALCNVAFILTAQGKRQQARQFYCQALLEDPNLTLARVALRKLEEPVDNGSAPDQDEKPTHGIRTVSHVEEAP
jgi:tetratricopeptide (TPR) repeat protein